MLGFRVIYIYIISDSDLGNIAIDLHPFVVGGVAESFRHVHGSNLTDLRCRSAPSAASCPHELFYPSDVFVGESLGALLGVRFGDHPRGWIFRIGQYQHPTIGVVNPHAIDQIEPPILRLFHQDPHHRTLSIPRCDHFETHHMDRWNRVDHL